jgi:hypothetical protein
MHTVIETPAFLASATDEHVSDDERQAIVSFMASNPDAGEIMPGTGGARKIRFAGRGRAKVADIESLRFTRRRICRCFCSISTARTRKPTCRGYSAMNSGKC